MSGTAFIGLGMMGQGMARNMLSKGIALRGFDLNAAARTRFANFGGTACVTAALAAQGCDMVFVMVQTAAQARQVLFADGVAAALNPQSVIVLCSTISASDMRRISAEVAAIGHDLLAAPVSGGQVGADAGTLTIMASGPERAMKKALPALQAVAKKVHQLGTDPGLGATYKVVHQLAAGVHLVAAAELMALGVKAGCDPHKLYEIVSSSAGNSWMFGDRAPRMMEADPRATSSVDIFLKDMSLVLQTGEETGVPLPLAQAAFQMLKAAGEMGCGPSDDSTVVRAYEEVTGAVVHKATTE